MFDPIIIGCITPIFFFGLIKKNYWMCMLAIVLMIALSSTASILVEDEASSWFSEITFYTVLYGGLHLLYVIFYLVYTKWRNNK